MVGAYDTHSILKYNSKPACLLLMTKCHPMSLGSWKKSHTQGPLPGAAKGPEALGPWAAPGRGLWVWHFSMIPRAGMAFCPNASCPDYHKKQKGEQQWTKSWLSLRRLQFGRTAESQIFLPRLISEKRGRGRGSVELS